MAVHPSQSLTSEPDGALIMRFRAGGIQEMCWHLFTWGTAVTVVAPEDLRSSLAEMTAGAAAHHGAGTAVGNAAVPNGDYST